MSEQFANLASTTLNSSYSTGAGSISVASATGFPGSGTFTVVIINSSTGAVILLFRVTSVSGTTFTGAAEGTDANAASGSTVLGTMLTAAAMSQVETDVLGHFIENETPSGTVNGSNVTFTLAHTPSPAGSLKLFKNGVLLIQGTDYTISTATITMTTAPLTGAILNAFYRD